MAFSTFQFLITTLLAIICARAISVNHIELSIFAFIIPALWIMPQAKVASLFLLLGLTLFGMTLDIQPVELSVSVWIVCPMLMVAYSKRSNAKVLIGMSSLFALMQTGIIVSQLNGQIGGSAMYTIMQICAAVMVWLATSSWKVSNKHSWWSLILLIPLVIFGYEYSALVALCIIGIMVSIETFPRNKSINWHKLLCWSLPTSAFASLVVTSASKSLGIVTVVWILLLAAAWMTDYVMRLDESLNE
jgi:hypothetical protein